MKKHIDMPLIVKARPYLIEPIATLEAQQIAPELSDDEQAFLDQHAK
ncbi:hypothetical protein [Pseudomonas sp. CGJS7]